MASENLSPPQLVFYSRSLAQPPLVESLHLAFRSQGQDFDYRLTDSIESAVEAALRTSRSVVLVNCLLKEDLTDLEAVFKQLKPRVEQGTLRIIVLNSLKHPNLAGFFQGRIALEVVDLPVTQKVLQHQVKNSLIFVQQGQAKREVSAPEKAVNSAPLEKFRSDAWLPGKRTESSEPVVDDSVLGDAVADFIRSTLETYPDVSSGIETEEHNGDPTLRGMHMGVDIVKPNGSGAQDFKTPQIYDVNRRGATLMLETRTPESPFPQVGDRFLFRFQFDLGKWKNSCLLEWELNQIEMALDTQWLASGTFISGEFAPLSIAMDQVEAKVQALQEFYRLARG